MNTTNPPQPPGSNTTVTKVVQELLWFHVALKERSQYNTHHCSSPRPFARYEADKMALFKAKDTSWCIAGSPSPLEISPFFLSSKIRIKESRSFQPNIQETRSAIALHAHENSGRRWWHWSLLLKCCLDLNNLTKSHNKFYRMTHCSLTSAFFFSCFSCISLICPSTRRLQVVSIYRTYSGDMDEHLAFDKVKPGVDITFCLGLVLLHQNRTNKLVHVVLGR